MNERFWSKVRRGADDVCWAWIAPNKNGYGHFYHEGCNHAAHRFSYELANGPIPSGLVIDHICRNRACVNPRHLRAVTRYQNVHENSDALAYHNAQKTHCSNGHPFAGDNLVLKPGKRVCRACHNAATRARQKRNRPKDKPFGRQLKMVCAQGHPLEGANLFISASGQRKCRECHIAMNRAYRLRKVASLRGSSDLAN